MKAEDNTDIASPLKSAYKKLFYMSDKKKHLRRCFRIAVREFSDFFHINNQKTIFLNERAVSLHRNK